MATAAYTINEDRGLEEKDLIKDGIDSGATTPALKEEGDLRTSALSRKVQHQFLAALNCVTTLQGFNDSTTGPLLLSMQAYYGVSYDLISLCFIVQFTGNFGASFGTLWMTEKLGYGKMCAFGSLVQGSAYVILICRPPFPLFLISYWLIGFGTSMQASQVNGFIGRLPNAKTKMYLNQTVYGLAGLISSLIASQFATVALWRYQFGILIFVALGDFVALTLAFRWMREDAIFARYNYMPAEEESEIEKRLQELSVTASGIPTLDFEDPIVVKDSSGKKLVAILKNPVVYLMSVFFWLYVGTEVGLGSWAVTYMVKVKGGQQANSGYISTGFFGGLTVGRFMQVFVGRKFRERWVVPIYTASALAFMIVVWLVPNYYAGAFCIALCGVALGPMSPIVFNTTIDLLPKDLRVGALALIGSLGFTGSATFPFLDGILSQAVGVWSIMPLVVGCLGGMLIFWEATQWAAKRGSSS